MLDQGESERTEVYHHHCWKQLKNRKENVREDNQTEEVTRECGKLTRAESLHLSVMKQERL